MLTSQFVTSADLISRSEDLKKGDVEKRMKRKETTPWRRCQREREIAHWNKCQNKKKRDEAA